MSAIQDMRRAVYTLSEHGRDIDCQSSANQYRIDIIVNKKRRERWRPYGLRLLPPAGGGRRGEASEGAQTGGTPSARCPPPNLPPLGGGPRPWPCGGGVSSACASLLFPIMSNMHKPRVGLMPYDHSATLNYHGRGNRSC